MNQARSIEAASGSGGGFRVWHLSALVLFVAVAVVNIQDQRAGEPVLVALAVAGFAVYGLLGWLGWRFARGFRARVGATLLLVLYLAAMAAFFLVSTAAYLVIEYAYRNGKF